MHYKADALYHVYNRGNNGQQLFFTPAHYHHFLRLFRQHLAPCAEVLAYCLMPNHFHFLLHTTVAGTQPTAASTSTTTQPLSRGIGELLSSYSQGLNQQLGRQGGLFQPKTKDKQVDGPFCEPSYAATYLHYIHQNPMRAGLANGLDDWPYSSYRDYAGLRSGSLCDQQQAQRLLGLPRSTALFIQESAEAIDPTRVRDRWL
ncbi:transposase [Hymenobacter terricola]|uniref:transposase n=1 Tax=Hymenobacter terricola TaxID=2819236 RepID=UPI001B300438|nr:transposase [Hymenobacter terricola]